MAKPKVAFYWCASCGGCEETVVDLNHDLLGVADAVDIVFWPVAMDFKRKDVENLQDGEIAVSFINGAIRLEEQEEMAHLLRKKSELVVAFGSCSHMGGIPGLANFHDKEEIFNRVFKEVPTMDNPQGITPQLHTPVEGGELTLPEFYDTVKTLDQTVSVDYYLPGCPPPPDLIMNAINTILSGTLPVRGTVLAPTKALCDTCPVRDSKPDKISIRQIKRPWEVRLDPEKCFLDQGVICMGPATRSGCGETCIRANMPCRGCFGPVDGVIEQGASALTMVASLLGLDIEETLPEDQEKDLLDSIVDPAGTFYKFSLPASLLRRKRL